jgi:hypothetical protein
MWLDDIKTDLREIDRIGWYGLDSSGSGNEPVEGSCEHGNEPQGFHKYWDIW